MYKRSNFIELINFIDYKHNLTVQMIEIELNTNLNSNCVVTPWEIPFRHRIYPYIIVNILINKQTRMVFKYTRDLKICDNSFLEITESEMNQILIQLNSYILSELI